MSEEKDNGKGFRVEDRRTSSGGVQEKSEDQAVVEEVSEEKSSEESGGREDQGPGRDEQSGGAPEDSRMPKVDFSTFVFSLFSSALIQLGEMEDPVSGEKEQNLEGAKQTIDILNMMKEKTEGNLTEEENKFLENASAELKWKFLNAVKEKG